MLVAFPAKTGTAVSCSTITYLTYHLPSVSSCVRVQHHVIFPSVFFFCDGWRRRQKQQGGPPSHVPYSFELPEPSSRHHQRIQVAVDDRRTSILLCEFPTRMIATYILLYFENSRASRLCALAVRTALVKQLPCQGTTAVTTGNSWSFLIGI